MESRYSASVAAFALVLGVVLAAAPRGVRAQPEHPAHEQSSPEPIGAADSDAGTKALEKSSPEPPSPAPMGAVDPEPADPAPEGTPVDWNRIVRFDSGRDEGRRSYVSAESCRSKPCVLTVDGAIEFDIGAPDRFDIAFRLLHENRVTVVDYFEKRGLRDYVLVERMFNRKRNKDVWSLTERLKSGELDKLFVYGVHLQYHLEEGDLLVLDMVERDNPSNQRVYFFRFHKAGYRVRLDLALLIPINAVTYPKPEPPYKVSKLNAAASISLTKNQDPEASYWLIERILMAGAPTLFVGFLTRTLEKPMMTPDTQFDLFLGLGLTYFDFVFTAWGTNVIQKPHSTGLFFGVHVGKAFKFIRELNDSSPRKWDDYLEREAKREVVRP